MHTRVLRLVLSGLMGALLVVSKQAMSGLPNIEPVTLLIILFALELPRETPGAITVFLVLQGVLYGFGLWWAMYLYVWYLLAFLARLLRRMDHALGWAVFSGLYGLCFGGLCAAVYLVAKTPAFALSWWLSGLSYDAMHGVGNFALMLLLYRPLRTALRTAKKTDPWMKKRRAAQRVRHVFFVILRSFSSSQSRMPGRPACFRNQSRIEDEREKVESMSGSPSFRSESALQQALQ